MNKAIITLTASFALLTGACGGEDPDGSGGVGTQSSGLTCQTASDCGDGHTCLKVGSSAGCTPICTASANECTGKASCGGVGAMSVNVCQEPKPAEETPKAEEQPRIPCSSDAECSVLHPGAICATFQNHRDCTIPCAQESNCDMPTLGGVKMDFMTCIDDEGDSARKACLPDVRCFNDPTACITGFPGLGGL